MNAASKSIPALSGGMGEASRGARPQSWSDRGPPGTRARKPPPIEFRRTQGPVCVYTGPDPVAVWRPRPGIAGVRRKRAAIHGALMPVFLGLGVAVFCAGCVRVASYLGYSTAPVVVHLLYSM